MEECIISIERLQRICTSHNCDWHGAKVVNQDWIVTQAGDILCIPHSYGIYDYALEKDDWIIHMAEKRWVNLNTFLPAYFEACRRKGLKVVQMRISY